MFSWFSLRCLTTGRPLSLVARRETASAAARLT